MKRCIRRLIHGMLPPTPASVTDVAGQLISSHRWHHWGDKRGQTATGDTIQG